MRDGSGSLSAVSLSNRNPRPSSQAGKASLEIILIILYCSQMVRLNPRNLTVTSRVPKPDGYVYARVPGHPYASKQGYVYEHRFVLEKRLGRFLKPGEIAHHGNEKKGDNRSLNIKYVPSQTAHMRMHHKDAYVSLACDQCGKKFIRVRNRIRTKLKFCSRSCSTKFLQRTGVLKMPFSRRARHGTKSKYSVGCRCWRCKKAQRVAVSKWRKGRVPNQQRG
jgi:hypothetical protein